MVAVLPYNIFHWLNMIYTKYSSFQCIHFFFILAKTLIVGFCIKDKFLAIIFAYLDFPSAIKSYFTHILKETIFFSST